jgi:imidazoleglycerol-phosphate dehydratase|uniref:Imidazoleglycerol-phosphate dehydratase n=1 Tax=candidate division WOR-3 bacterium TaxID=2052148 RepID=A0A7V3RGX0_UNCW3
MREGEVERKTKETDIRIKLRIEGNGESHIKSPIGFLNHMLETLTRHSGFDIDAEINGDIHVDQHHIVEDTGYCLGTALNQALREKRGINRAGCFIYPMDEALAMVAIDISGRPLLKFSGRFKSEKIGDFKTELVQDFFAGFTNGCLCTIHIRLLSGKSDHHKLEAIFKAFAHALKQACMIGNRDYVPSTKGVI